MYTVATKTLSLIIDSTPLARKNIAGRISELHRQYRVDNRREQVLIMDHCDDGKEHHQQGGEGQGLLKRVADLVLLDNAVEGG